MKKIILIAAAMTLTACQSKTEFGNCIGAFDEKDPKYVWKVSGRNAAIGIIFVSLVIPPVLVVTDQTFCPVGLK